MDVAKIYTKVEEAIKRKNFDFAIEMLKNQILKFNPNDVKARKLLRATVLEKYKVNGFPSKTDAIVKGLAPRIKMFIGKMLKKWEMVVDEAENYLELDPKNISVLYNLGQASMEAGYVDTAIAVFESILAFNASHINALKALGKIYYIHKKEMDKAHQYYQRAVRIATSDIEAAKMVKDISAQITAQTYAKADSSRDLIKDKNKAKELEEDQAVLRTEEDIQRAIDRTKKKLAQDPNNKKELRRLADLHQKIGLYDEALTTLNTLLEQDPTNFDVKCKIGECKITQMKQNIRTIQDSLKKTPQNQALRQKLEELTNQKNEMEVAEYEMQVQSQPTNYELRFKLGLALYTAKRYDEAIAHLQHAIQDPRNKVPAYKYMGQAFAHKKDFDLAVEQYESALKLLNASDSQYREVKYNLGLAFEYGGKKEKAIETYTEIYKVDIGYKDVQDRLKRLKG